MGKRWVRVAAIAAVAALAGMPGLATAQTGGFPSQDDFGGGNFPSQQDDGGGNFPSQGGGGNFPSQGGDQPAARGGFFQSDAFAFSFTWDGAWELVGEDSEPGFEAVAIGNGVSTVMVMGVDVSQSPQNPQQFVEDAAAGLGIPDLQFSQVVFDETDRAGAVYESPSLGSGIFLDAIRRDPTTMIVVFWQFPTAQFDAEIGGFEAVMTGLQF